MTTETISPADDSGIHDSLHGHGEHSWCTHCRAEKEQDRADAERQHDTAIDRAVSALVISLREAGAGLAGAQSARAALAELYDVELVESPLGADLMRALADAEYALRHAALIAECRAALLEPAPVAVRYLATISAGTGHAGVAQSLTVMAAGDCEPSLGPVDLDVAPHHPARYERAKSEADTLLAREGWRRTSEWLIDCAEASAGVERQQAAGTED